MPTTASSTEGPGTALGVVDEIAPAALSVSPPGDSSLTRGSLGGGRPRPPRREAGVPAER